MDVGYLLVGWGWSFDQMRAGWIELEQLGFDLCYIGDDLFPHPQLDATVFDPWTLLPAMAVTTERMRIGSLVSPAGRRHPGLFAKMTTGVDQASRGRLVVGMGAGNAPEQQESLHQPYLGPTERAQMLREELTILRSLWTEPRTTFTGAFYETSAAVCEPKGVGEPHPEVLVALKNATLMAPIAGEFATRANLLGNDDDAVQSLAGVIRDHAARLGRDPEGITMGRLFQVLFTPDRVVPDQLEGVLTRRAIEIGVEPDELIQYHRHVASYVGPPEGAAEAIIARTHAIGVNEVVLDIDTVGMIDYERTMDGIRTFAHEVLGPLRLGSS